MVSLLDAGGVNRTGDEIRYLHPKWTIGGKQVGIIAADDQGFYAEEGLSVTILRGYSSPDTVERVAEGEGEFRYVDITAPLYF